MKLLRFDVDVFGRESRRPEMKLSCSAWKMSVILSSRFSLKPDRREGGGLLDLYVL